MKDAKENELISSQANRFFLCQRVYLSGLLLHRNFITDKLHNVQHVLKHRPFSTAFTILKFYVYLFSNLNCITEYIPTKKAAP
uniref:Uncharacterized protein n=1 Tax=Rhizophora mucronata TaxID=61149 RepID=A0A2P2Q4J2_RHIMU